MTTPSDPLDQRRHTHPAPPRMPPPDIPPDEVARAWSSTLRVKAGAPPDVLHVVNGPDRSLHVIGMALAAISGALVGFVIRGLL